MKKLVALILVCLLCMATTAFAAEWAEGLSPAKPSNLKPAVDLNTTVGYWLPFPRSGLPAERYCDVLELYMPNPDVALGEGTATLWNADGEVAKVDFADPDQVEMRNLEEEELEIMHWGSGVCIEMHLPVSLAFGETYYVTMDEGTITSNGGKTKSMQIPYTDQLPLEEQYWTPSVTGDFGVGGLYYSAAPAEPTDEEEEAAEPAEEASAEPAEEAPAEPKLKPAKGDVVNFDVVLGGDAKTAIMYSENNSVYFETLEYTENSHVTGTVTEDDVRWGVVFVDEAGQPVDYLVMGNLDEAEETAE